MLRMMASTDIDQRIAQWEKMTQADPQNDMGWFSLGNAYKDAHRLEDADRALAQALQLNPTMSRAYQLRGQVLIGLNRNQDAGQVLTQGYTIAAERGDVMPQRAMGSLLEKLGLPIPQVKTPTGSVASAETSGVSGVSGVVSGGGQTVLDRRTGRPGTRLPDPPIRGPLGKFIYDHYSLETWREWIGMGTKVINELRLDFSNVEHQKVYDRHMMEWLGISQEEVDAYAASTDKPGQS